MARDRETIWNAGANRWNIGKLVAGVLFAVFALRMMLALTILVGPVNFPNAHPGIQASPLYVAVVSAAMAALCGWAFHRLERARQRTLAG